MNVCCSRENKKPAARLDRCVYMAITRESGISSCSALYCCIYNPFIELYVRVARAEISFREKYIIMRRVICWKLISRVYIVYRELIGFSLISGDFVKKTRA